MNIRVMIFAPRVLEMRLVTTLRAVMIRRLLALGCVATAAAWANVSVVDAGPGRMRVRAEGRSLQLDGLQVRRR